MNWEFPDAQARLKRGRGNRSNCQNLLDYGESIGLQKNCYFCFIDNTKVFDCVDHKKNNGKFLKRWECQTTFSISWETWMHFKKQHLELDMEQ